MRRRLEHLDRARREFIANASHELRTPLFSLGGFLELMADEDLDEATRQEFLETMREQVARLAKLATDLLDLSRLDAGRMRIEHARGRSRATSRELSGGVPRARGRAAATRSRWSSRAADRARGRAARAPDRARARRERDPSTARRHARDPPRPSRPRARLPDVEDEGPACRTEQAPHLFERFYRVDGDRSSGSGLGLAIARELASDGR